MKFYDVFPLMILKIKYRLPYVLVLHKDSFACHYWAIFIECVKCYCLCVLRWLTVPILALNCLLQIEQERSEGESSVDDALALAEYVSAQRRWFIWYYIWSSGMVPYIYTLSLTKYPRLATETEMLGAKGIYIKCASVNATVSRLSIQTSYKWLQMLPSIIFIQTDVP